MSRPRPAPAARLWMPTLAACAMFALLFGLGLYRHHDDLWASGLHRDESIFARAFAAARSGASPYSEPYFYYPPPFAILGGWLWSALGERRFFVALRHLELLGVCGVAWLAAASTRWRPAVRWAAAAAIVAFSFPVINALGVGNVSPILQGLTVAAMAVSGSWPLLGGVLLGTGIALKPLAVAAVPLLAVYGWRRDPAALRMAFSAALSASLLVATLGARFLAEILGRAELSPGPEHDVSVGRILRGFAMAPPAKLIFAAVVLIAAVYLLRTRLARRDMQAVVLVACVFSLPIVWAHTLLLTLPLQLMAFERAFDDPRRWRLARVALVAVAVYSLNAISGSDAAPRDWPPFVLSAIAALPLLTVLGLCAYALSAGARPGPRSDTT